MTLSAKVGNEEHDNCISRDNCHVSTAINNRIHS